MKRSLYTDLLDWKKSQKRKPLLLQGARQVGKTYLINEFAHKEYKNYIYLNFELDPNLEILFQGKLDPKEIMQNISLYFGKKIDHKDTLIFFDEIQIIPRAISSLKYFYEQAPEFHVVAAGSLLGVSVGKQSSFPVGKVNFLQMYPLNFSEYLMAFKEDLLLNELKKHKVGTPIIELLHQKLLTHLKMYLFLGGMPEVLQDFIKYNDIKSARLIQNEILTAYEKDFSKYAVPSQAVKTAELWRSIPFQLARENKKFKYGDVRKNSRASTYEQTIEWLKSAGLIHVSYSINTPKLPLAAYTDYSKFKLFMLDTGLLGAMLNISSEIIINPNKLFAEYNGAFIENFVALELKSAGVNQLYYWTSKSDAEVDFIIQLQNAIFPLEVKSGHSRNLKSIRTYEEKYKPSCIFRVSPRNFFTDKEFVDLPLYGAFLLKDDLLEKR